MPRDENGESSFAGLEVALGLDARDVLDAAARDDQGDTLALLRLWNGVTDRQGRARILSLARQEALRCGFEAEDQPSGNSHSRG